MDTLIGEYRYLSPIAMSIKFMMTFKVSANLRGKSSESHKEEIFGIKLPLRELSSEA